MIRIVFALLLVLCTYFGGPSVAGVNPSPDLLEACYKLLRQHHFTIPHFLSTQPAWLRGGLIGANDQGDLDLDFSVRVGLPRPHLIAQGAALRIQKKSGRRWFSAYGVHPSDLQGDPRYPILFLGREVAAILGYFMPDENTVIYPTVERINFGIKLLNTLLNPRDQIQVRFYEQDQGSSLGYLEHLVDLKIPVSTDDVYLAVHDHVFHVPMVLAAPTVLHRMQILAREIGLDFLKKYEVDTADESNRLRPMMESIFNSVVAYPSALLMGGRQHLRAQSTYVLNDLAILFGHGDVGEFMERIADSSQAPYELKDYLSTQKMVFRGLSYRLNSLEGVGSGRNSQEVMRDLLARRHVLKEAAIHVMNRPPQQTGAEDGRR